MRKVLWIDTETTGFSASKNDIVQVAGIVEIDGEVVETFDLNCRALNPENIQPAALECNGLTREAILAYPDPEIVILHILQLGHKYVDGGDTFIFGAHNASFDLRMMKGLFVKNGYEEEQFTEYLSGGIIDTMKMLKTYSKAHPEADIANSKLITGTLYFDIKHNSHEAMSDITATRELYLTLQELEA